MLYKSQHIGHFCGSIVYSIETANGDPNCLSTIKGRTINIEQSVQVKLFGVPLHMLNGDHRDKWRHQRCMYVSMYGVLLNFSASK